MATIDQQFVEYIVKTLVNNPDDVRVEREIDERGVLLSLTVNPEDVGRVIGRRGVTAQAIRVLLRALGTKQDARFNLKIMNTDEGRTHEESEETKANEAPANEAEEEAVEAVEEKVAEVEPEEEAEEEETAASHLAEKTRAELADYDDLDI